MSAFDDLKLRFDALVASNASLASKVTELQADVAQTLGLVNDLSVAAVVLKDAYDVIKVSIQNGGTPAQIAEMLAQTDLLIAEQASTLATATASKAALDAQDLALAALPVSLTP